MCRAAQYWATWFAFLSLVSCTSPPAVGSSSSPRSTAGDHPSILASSAPTESSSTPSASDAPDSLRPGSLTPPVAIRVGYTPNGANAGIYIALARGYFEAEGLDVSLEPFDTGERIIPALAAGQLDVSAAPISAGLFNALARGVALEMVAGQVLDVAGPPNGAALVIRKDLFDAGRVRDYADLRGLRIGHSGVSSASGVVFTRLLALGGLEESDVEATEIPAGADQATALINGRLDAVLMTEPFVTRVVQAGMGVRWKNLGDIYSNRQATVLLYATPFPRLQSKAAVRFLVAYLRGARDYVTAMSGGADRTPIYRILAEYTPIKDLALYAALAPANLSPDGGLYTDSMLADQAFWMQRGLIPQPADLAAASHLEYLEAARRSVAAPGSGTFNDAPAVGMSQPGAHAAVNGVQPRPRVHIGELGIVPAGMVYVAEAKGYFAEQGLDVEFQRFDAGPSMIPALSTAQIEVASSGINLGTFNAMARDLPIVLVADSGYDGRDTSLIVRADLPGHLQRPADLVGRRVAINGPGTILEYMLGRAVERDGSRWDAIDVQYIPFPDMRTALDNGAVDVVYSPEPFPTLMERAGTGYRWLDGQALVPDPRVQAGAIVYNRTWATSNPARAQSVAVAILRGIRDMISAAEGGVNRAEVIDILVEHTPVKDRAFYDSIPWPGLHRNGELNIDSMVDQQQWYASHGQLSQPVDVSRFIDLSYIRAAAAQLGPYVGLGGY